MVYFRCTSSGSGKGNTVVVTCADEFAGQTITLSKTGKTYRKTCPSTAPYVVTFYGVEAGTYTVSATVSGQTYSTEVIVQDVSCVLNYGFTWKTWVDTASQLDSTDYASLSEVLADEEAVRELFLEHACVDYMAEATSSNAYLETIIENDLCAKWINNSDYALDFLGANTVIKALMDTADKYGYGEWVVIDDTTTPPTYGPKGNVPVMTANNAPYGTASASSEYNANNAAWKAFNGVLTDWWSCTQNQANPHITYKFTVPTAIKRVRHWQNENGGATCKIRWSDDGVNFTDVADSQYTTEKNDWVTKNIDNTDYHLYWDVYFITTVSGFSSSNLQFYGRSLSVSVPTMTSNTAPFGEASASSQYDGNYAAYKAFDDSSSDYYLASSSDTLENFYLRYDFPNAIELSRVRILHTVTTGNTFIAKLQYSTDGTAWTDVPNVETTNQAGDQDEYFDVKPSIRAKCFRWVGVSGKPYLPNYGGFGVNIIQFYGKDYSEKEFEVGTTKKWLYDHGVELVNTQYRKGSRGVDPEKYDDFIKLQSSSASNSFCYCDFVESLVNYNLARVKIRDVTLSMYSNYYFQGVLGLNDDSAFSAVDSRLLPNNLSLNISSVNDSTKRISVGANSAGNGILTFTELWLE